MPKPLALSILIAATFLPAGAHAQQVASAADLRYCAQLSELYVRYVGRSEAGPDVPVKPDVNGGVALAKCHEGDAAASIPILERKLRQRGISACRCAADPGHRKPACRRRFLAGAFALPAGFGANAAVLVMVRVPVAFVCAVAAEICAGFQHLHHQSRRRCGSPRQDRPGGGTGIGAVEAEADAAGEGRCAGLRQAGIGARYAGLGGVEAGLYTLHEDVVDATGRLGMAGQRLARTPAHCRLLPVRSRIRHQRRTPPTSYRHVPV